MRRRIARWVELNEVCTQALAVGMPVDMVREMRRQAKAQSRAYPLYRAAQHARFQLNAYVRAMHRSQP